MNKVSIDLENCFGIGKLIHEFDYLTNNSNTAVIYAPNGTMKTSFARTFDLISKEDLKNLPRDRVHSHRISKFDISPASASILLVPITKSHSSLK